MPLLPHFGSVDIIAPQWLYISVINFIFLFDFLFSKPFLLKFNSKSSIILIYSLFLIFSWFSLLYTNNLSVTFLDLFRLSSIFVLTILIINYYKQLENKKILYLILAISCLTESIYSLSPFFFQFFFGDLSSINYDSLPNSLLGFAGNKNITIASILIKFPFALAYFKSRSVYGNLFIFLYSFFIFLSVYLISARASFISFLLISILFLSRELFLIFSRKSFRFGFLSFFSAIILVYYMMSNVITGSIINLSDRVSSIEISDESSSNRFSLWSDALDYIYNNPIFGCGLGNWKIESLPYWKFKLSGYTVPYHAHNDFLEITTELGILGGILYLLIFILTFLKLFNYIIFSRHKILFFTLLSSFCVYFIDANLNFPLERPLMQVMFALLLGVTIVETSKSST